MAEDEADAGDYRPGPGVSPLSKRMRKVLVQRSRQMRQMRKRIRELEGNNNPSRLPSDASASSLSDDGNSSPHTAHTTPIQFTPGNGPTSSKRRTRAAILADHDDDDGPAADGVVQSIHQRIERAEPSISANDAVQHPDESERKSKNEHDDQLEPVSTQHSLQQRVAHLEEQLQYVIAERDELRSQLDSMNDERSTWLLSATGPRDKSYRVTIEQRDAAYEERDRAKTEEQRLLAIIDDLEKKRESDEQETRHMREKLDEKEVELLELRQELDEGRDDTEPAESEHGEEEQTEVDEQYGDFESDKALPQSLCKQPHEQQDPFERSDAKSATSDCESESEQRQCLHKRGSGSRASSEHEHSLPSGDVAATSEPCLTLNEGGGQEVVRASSRRKSGRWIHIMLVLTVLAGMMIADDGMLRRIERFVFSVSGRSGHIPT